MTESRVFVVSREAQQRQRLGKVKDEMEGVAVTPTPPPEPITESLEALVEDQLKRQLRDATGKDLNIPIMNSIRFLAVRARMPVAFGGELDEPPGEPTA